MSLPIPDLDNRTFQDIVDDVKRQIGRRCPEWTDHNVHDPGVTLIELFASMTEMMLYQLNQVPEKNYLKFLEMIGVSLDPPSPAQVQLRFRLTRDIFDRDGEEDFERLLKARETVAATVRTEYEEAIEFVTDHDLRLVRPRLAHVVAIPAVETGVTGESQARNAREFVKDEGAFPVFSATPRSGDGLYLGFETDLSSNLVSLEVDCIQAAAVGLDEDYPAQAWEVWNQADDRWDPLEYKDTTFGFNLGPGKDRSGERTGYIEFAMPRGMMPREIGGRKGYWIRCRYTPDLPARGVDKRKPKPYEKPPEFTAMSARVTGGIATALNCRTVFFKDLGQSDGQPGQVFPLGHAPVLSRNEGETVLVGEQGTPREDLERWIEVQDFSESGPDDRHFVCDSYKGEILFGPEIIQPDGSPRRHGKIPTKGMTITFSCYRYGGGTKGNVAAKQVTILKSSIPYIADVTNPQRAVGGRELESVARAKLRGQAILRRRERAVTPEDYEYLACQASSGVARARCVQPRALHATGVNGDRIPPGVVRVLLVPSLSNTVTTPRPDDLRVPPQIQQHVYEFLDRRRLLTTVLEVGEPDYVYVSTDIRLVADPKADADQVVRNVQARLETFIHPLLGGPTKTGWPFQRPLTLSDIYAEIQNASGVAFLRDARIYISRLAAPGDRLLSPEVAVSNAEGVRLGDNELLCSREHRIRAIPMWAVGIDDTIAD